MTYIIEQNSPKRWQPSEAQLLQASGEFQIKFEELGFEVEDGFEAGMYEGTAQVTWWNDEGQLIWFVQDIVVRCFKWNGKEHEQKFVWLDRDSRLYDDIWTKLTTEQSWKDFIDGKVEEQL